MKDASLKGSEKVCKTCKEVKDKSQFPKRGNHRLNSCDPCYKEYVNLQYRIRYREDTEFNRKRRELARKAQIKSKYNTTEEKVLETLKQQQFKCANPNCRIDIVYTKQEKFENQAVIDHNHGTGNFRALLCQRCNLILGYLETRPTIVEGLYQYLKTFTDKI